MGSKVCPVCKEVIDGKYIIVACDRPYINLFFHPEHLVADKEEIARYIKEMLKYKS